MSLKGRWRILAALLLLLAFCSLIGLSIGSVSIPFEAVVRILLADILSRPDLSEQYGSGWTTIIVTLRLPVVIMALFTGAALSTSGASLQGLFKNPLADPYIIGISAGGSLGWVAALIITYGDSGALVNWFRALMSFIGAMGAVFTAYLISRTGYRTPVSNLLLAGIAISASLTAFSQFLIYNFVENPRQVLITLLGTCSNSRWHEIAVIAPVVLIGIPLLVLKARDLNALSVGEEDARGLGVDVERTKITVLVIGSLLAAVTVPFCGMIGFVGLMVPHMVRRFVGPDHRWLIPASALFGASFLIICDLISRSLMERIIPLGVVTGLAGGVFFLYLLRARRDAY